METGERKRKKVLIAEGSAFERVMLTTALEKLDFEVVGTAKDGKEAVDEYKELKPDIVLVDAELKGMDGIEVTRIIANQTPSAFVIVLINKSLHLEDIAIEAVRAGAKGYLMKPLSLLDSSFLAHGRGRV